MKRLFSSQQENSLKNYFSVGRYYVSKKVIYILALGVLALTIYLFLNPPAFLDWRGGVMTIYEKLDQQPTATGQVRYFDLNKTLKYEGHMVNGLYDGQGQLYQDGQLIYDGQFSAGYQEGFGRLYNENGTLIYEGEFQKNSRHGTGKAYNELGQLTYDGQFEQDAMNGQGEFYNHLKQLVYKGDVVQGEFSGQGVSYYADQAVEYEGDFHAGKFGGNGKLYNKNGSLLYEGGFNQGQYSDQGTLYDPSGFILYKGQFSRGMYHGEGQLYAESGELQFQGAFSNGLYHGQGTLYDQDGRLRYEGSFSKGSFDGIGALFNPDGFMIYKGIFHNGQIAIHRYLTLAHAQIIELLGEPSKINNLSAPINAMQDQGDGLQELQQEPQPEPATDIDDWHTFELVYENYQMSFTIERDNDNPNATNVIEVQVWGAELLKQLDAELNELSEQHSADKSAEVSKTSSQIHTGRSISIFHVDDFQYLFSIDDEREAISQLRVTYR